MRRLGGAWAAAAAAALALALALVGCNANPAGTGTGPAKGTTAVTKGGTLTILNSSTSINFDPAKSQNLAITTLGLLQRRLTTWDIQPGKPAAVVPDLATDTGKSSDGGRTWTYQLKDGLKFSDGTAITAADIKYGVERSFAPELSGGLGYHKGLLAGGGQYKGPYTGGELASVQTRARSSSISTFRTVTGPGSSRRPRSRRCPRARTTRSPTASTRCAAARTRWSPTGRACRSR